MAAMQRRFYAVPRPPGSREAINRADPASDAAERCSRSRAMIIAGVFSDAMEVIRAEVAGSLLRPAQLLEARAAHLAGTLSATELKRVEDRAVDAAIAKQEAAGVDIVSDGELRRMSFMEPLTVSGYGPVSGNTFRWYGDDDAIDFDFPVAVTGRLALDSSIVVEEYSYARARTGRPVKATLPSPLMTAGSWMAQYSVGAYPDPYELIADAAEIVAAQVRTLARLGCRHIQIDAPELTMAADPRIHAWFKSRGVAPERLLAEGVEILNGIVDGVPDVRFVLHICRGNNQGRWMTDIGYDALAETVFRRTPAFDAYLLEYDDARSGSFDALAAIPDDKHVALGLVSTKRGTLEPAEALEARIRDAARFHPLDSLGICTQCGFASTMAGNPLTADDEARKLALVASVARRVWDGA
jgi:5-methyltetrahydropteroyltriglutamate--homocysteine methyltransferase